MKVSEHLSEKELQNFTKRLLAETVDIHGFGVIGQAEMEALMFDELLKTAAFKGISNADLAARLRIPESAVRALLLTVGIRYRRGSPRAVKSGTVALRKSARRTG